MKKSLALRLAAFLLCALLLIPALISCGGNGGEETKDPAGDTTVAPDVTTEPVETEELPVLPEEHTYDGYEFLILVGGYWTYNDFETNEEATDVLSQAKYNWIEKANEEFDIAITSEAKYNFNATRGAGPGYQALADNYAASDPVYDASSITSYDSAALALNGYISNLKEFEYIDLEKSWWDQKANEDIAINGKMYFTTGDIALVDNVTTHTILFNKGLVEESDKLANPYDLVRADKWTYAAMIEMIKEVAEDVNGDDKRNDLDKYGLLTWNDAGLQIFASAGERVSKVNADGEFELTIYNDRTVSLVDTYMGLVNDSEHVYNYQTGNGTSAWDTIRTTMFDENRALFYMSTFQTISKHRDSNVDFGIIPFPKYSEDQKDYGHLVSAFHSQFISVPTFYEDADITGSVLEYLAYLGQDTVLPAYYEKTLKGTYIKDDESAEMLDIIYASHVFDLGIYYRVGNLYSSLGSVFTNKKLTLTFVYTSVEKSANADIKDINAAFAD